MPDFFQVLQDYLAASQWVPASIVAVLIIVPLILKALGKKVPVLDPIIQVAFELLQKMAPKKDPAKVATPAEQPGVEKVAKIVPIEELKK